MPRVVVAILCVLLLCLQQEGYRHGVDHLRAELAQAHERALQSAGEPCDECALLAGAAHAIAGSSIDRAAPPHAAASLPWPAATAAAASPRFYAARAPPAQA